MIRIGVVTALALCASPYGAPAQSAAPILPAVPMQYHVAVKDSAAAARAFDRWGMRHEVVYGPLWRAWFPIWTMGAWADSLRAARWADSATVTMDQLHEAQFLDGDAVADRPTDVPWNVTMVRAPEVWARGIDGTGQVVVVMDSGLDCDHPDLRIRGGYAFVDVIGGNPAACASWDDTASGCKGHGTHVGGIAQAVAPGVELFGAKVFSGLNGGCGAWESTMMATLMMARDSGFVTVTSSISGSVGGAAMLVLTDAAARGTWVAGASGNSSSVAQGWGTHPFSMSVGSVAASGYKSSFSGQGAALDIMAPGQSIVSTMPGGGYGTKSGTSMAGPHVSGVIAMMKQRKPDLTTGELQLAINRTAVPKGVAGWDASYGWGLIDALAIDDYLIAHPGRTMPPPTYTLSRDSVTLSESTSPQQFGYMVDTVGVVPEIDAWAAQSDPSSSGVVIAPSYTQGSTGTKGLALRVLTGLGVPTFRVWLEF